MKPIPLRDLVTRVRKNSLRSLRSHPGIGAVALLCALGILIAPWFAAATFDETSLPVGNVLTTDGVVTGTVRIEDGRLTFYNGSRLQSMDGNLAVNFRRGGSLVLCPHSQVQILTANQNAGMMVAFQDGGSEEPFAVRLHDVVMTPDWRIEVGGDAAAASDSAAEAGLLHLELMATRPGTLCLTGDAKPGMFFHVSQMAGDASFNVRGQGNARFSDGQMESFAGGCACDDVPAQAVFTDTPPAAVVNAVANAHTIASAGRPAALTARVAPSPAGGGQQELQAAVETDGPKKRKQHPQDVVGYVRSFVHLLFGR